ILFGSYAYGKPNDESDVDLMVIMPARNVIDQEIRIDLTFEPPFSLDLHVRTPYQIRTRLKEGDCDWFLYEVMTKGKVLDDASDRRMGENRRRGPALGKNTGSGTASATKSGVLPLSAGSRKVPQGSSSRTRVCRPERA